MINDSLVNQRSESYRKIKSIEEFREYIKDKTVAVIGLGISNISLIKFLCDCKAKKIRARDKKNVLEDNPQSELAKFAEKENIEFIFGDNYLDDLTEDVIFKTPVIRRDLQEFADVIDGGGIVTSEIELFFMLCKAKKISVTGSEGKTTTTTLIGEILRADNKTVFVGGNIGYPLISEVEHIKESDFVVAELSSFQLFDLNNGIFAPNLAVITNVTPNHLDWHKDIVEYADAKKIIFANQKPNDRIVLNYDNEITKSFGRQAKSTVFYFSQQKLSDCFKNCIYCHEDAIFVRRDGVDQKILDKGDIVIHGSHNVENFMAAIGILCDTVSVDSIKKVAATFRGVEHRLEYVRELNGILYYNNSAASSPTRTIAALNSFDELKKVIVILGGYDKKIAFDPLVPVVIERAKAAVLYGATKEKIKQSFDEYRENTADSETESVDLYIEDSFDCAVNKANELAVSGDVVLLAPACASFDCFKNFEERGNRFKEIVMGLT